MNATTAKFSYNAAEKLFVTEASDLGPVGTHYFHQIYPDAADIGLILTSHRTGHEATFYLDHTETQEGEIKWWNLKPTTETVRKVPTLAGATLRIFND